MMKISAFETIKNRIAFFFVSFRLSVICLSYAAILVICGTIYQVDHGLYAAQERFFRSWFFFILGFLPLPGLQTVLLLAIINSICLVMKRVRFVWQNAGLLSMHVGAVFLIVGAGASSRFINESSVMFSKGQTVAESVDFKNWELLVSVQGSFNGAPINRTIRKNFSDLKQGKSLQVFQNGKKLAVQRVFDNCQASGRGYDRIDSLWPVAAASSGSIPGVELSYCQNDNANNPNNKIYVFGGVGEAVSLFRGNDTLVVSLLPRRMILPLKISLKDFVLENHPGTSNAKKIESHIHVLSEGIDREVVISMNRPFRYNAFTFYQTGFSGETGQMSSKLTVVENPVRFLPHAACTIIVFGMLFHYLVRLFKTMKANKWSR
jgi:hypothetical protein